MEPLHTNFSYSFSENKFKTRRAELISRLTNGINSLRIHTKYKPTTERLVAIKTNKNPFLKSDDELENLINECERKSNYSKFFWVCG